MVWMFVIMFTILIVITESLFDVPRLNKYNWASRWFKAGLPETAAYSMWFMDSGVNRPWLLNLFKSIMIIHHNHSLLSSLANQLGRV